MTEYNNSQVDQLADFCVKVVEDKFAEEVCKINVSGKSSIADYFIVCTVNSEPQLRAVNSSLEREVREHFGLRNLSHAAPSTSGWVLIDFGDILVHVMTPEMRDRYSLETLWGKEPDEEAVKTLETLSERSE